MKRRYFIHRKKQLKRGKVLVLLAILLPSLLGIAGLVFDGGMMMSQQRDLQLAVDAAATAAGTDLRMNKGAAAAKVTAADMIAVGHGLAGAQVTVNIPPTSGKYAGQANHVEVIAKGDYGSRFMHVIDAVMHHEVCAHAVAGVQDVTNGAAIVVLDSDPVNLTVSGLSEILSAIDTSALITAAVQQSGMSEIVSGVPIVGTIVNNLLKTSLTSLLGGVVDDLWSLALGEVSLTPLPTLVGGLEVEGLGRLRVDGAILVNNEWGGEDENGVPTGIASPPPYAVACMPILATTRVNATDIRVAGGVDNSQMYKPFGPNGDAPLQAGRLPVPDPFNSLPVPSNATDSGNVSMTVYSPADVVQVAVPANVVNSLTSSVLFQLSALLKPLFQPLIAPVQQTLISQTLKPGVYNSITVLSPLGGAKFVPGVYIIRGTSPVTQMSLCIVGAVEANGVLFYITNSSGFSAANGMPDASENHQSSPANTLVSTLPSTLILPLTAGAHYSGLNDASSPFDGMLVYQRRMDRRPIVIEAQHLLGGGDISGTIYSKWGHVIFVGGLASYDLRFVCGTLRIVTATTTTLAPSAKLPPAQDVLLLE